MTKLDWFDRFEQRTSTSFLAGWVYFSGAPVVGIVAAWYFLQRYQVSWWLQIPAYILAVLLAFVLPLVFVVELFSSIRRRTGRKPLDEIERIIFDEQEEQEERAKTRFVSLGQSEQLYSLFLMHKQTLDHLKWINVLLQYLLIALIGLGVLLVVTQFLR